MFRKKFLPFCALAVIAASSAMPAFCQNRFMDEAREQAERRAENKAVREAEHPEAASPTQTANAAKPPAPPTAPVAAEAAPAAPVAPAEAVPAAPATPAQ